jgi:lipid-binding SYLF domain-containing protein
MLHLRPHPRILRLWLLFAMAVTSALVAATVHAQADQRRLVTAATATIASFLADPEMSWLQQNFSQARAVLIAPQVTKASIIVGGAGGRAIAVARDPRSGRWVGPAFYTLATASIGLQAGITVMEAVTLVMTDKGVSRLLSNSFTMGGDVAIAVGPIDAGARSNFVADLVTFSRGHGVYLGVNLDGTVVRTADDWDQLYYGRPVGAVDILVRTAVHNRQAKELLNVVAKAAGDSPEGASAKQR